MALSFSALAEMLDEAKPLGAVDEREEQPRGRLEVMERLERVRVEAALTGVPNVPVLKSVAMNSQLATRSEKANLEDLGDMVRRDPGLHTKILRMVNSSLFAVANEVVSIEHAMVLLGLKRMRYMAQSLSAVQELSQLSSAFDLRHLWSHSFACGLLADQLARLLHLGENPHVYSAGLLHDIGKILLSSCYPDAYREILRCSGGADFDLAMAERWVFGMDHEEAGGIFGKVQQLPKPILAVIAHHGRPEEAPENEREGVALLYLANHYAKVHGFGFSGNPAGTGRGDLINCLRLLPEAAFPGRQAENDWEEKLASVEVEVERLLLELFKEVDELVRLTFGRAAPWAHSG